MNQEDVTRDDWIIGGLALMLIIDLLFFPWRSIEPAAGGATGPAHPTTAESYAAIKAPARGLAVLAVLVLLVLIADLLWQRYAERSLPAIGGSRRTTRFVLAVLAGVFVALQFLLYVHFSQFGWGFYLAVILVVLLVYASARVSRGAAVIPATGR